MTVAMWATLIMPVLFLLSLFSEFSSRSEATVDRMNWYSTLSVLQCWLSLRGLSPSKSVRRFWFAVPLFLGCAMLSVPVLTLTGIFFDWPS